MDYSLGRSKLFQLNSELLAFFIFVVIFGVSLLPHRKVCKTQTWIV